MKRFRKLFFTLWYFCDPPWDTNITPPELIAFLHDHPPGRAIDMGCGTGTNVITLAKYNWQAVGIDYVNKAIRTARRKAKKAGVQVEFRAGDVTDMRWVIQPFDLVLDIGCLHSLQASDYLQYIRNLKDILAPGGTFLLYAFIKGLDSTCSGLTETDLGLISSQLERVAQEYGKDGNRDSGWFTFRKPCLPSKRT